MCLDIELRKLHDWSNCLYNFLSLESNIYWRRCINGGSNFFHRYLFPIIASYCIFPCY